MHRPWCAWLPQSLLMLIGDDCAVMTRLHYDSEGDAGAAFSRATAVLMNFDALAGVLLNDMPQYAGMCRRLTRQVLIDTRR